MQDNGGGALRYLIRLAVGSLFLVTGGYITMIGASLSTSGRRMDIGPVILGFGISIIGYSVLIMALLLNAHIMRSITEKDFKA